VSITADGGSLRVDGFEFRLDRAYDPVEGMWISDRGDGRHRIGLSALTADSYGALAQLTLDRAGTAVDRGSPFGSLEAAKFVGPLLSPLTGVVVALNSDVLDNPELVLAEPYDGGWLVEVECAGADSGLDLLVEGDLARAWFSHTVAEYREKGLVAE
jgi:glycine cleavage system H protein